MFSIDLKDDCFLFHPGSMPIFGLAYRERAFNSRLSDLVLQGFQFKASCFGPDSTLGLHQNVQAVLNMACQ